MADDVENKLNEPIGWVSEAVWEVVLKKNAHDELLQAAEEWGYAGIENWCNRYGFFGK